MRFLKKSVWFFSLALLATACSSGDTTATEDSTSTDSTVVTELVKEEVDLVAGYKVGDIAEDFQLKNVDGKMISMADYQDAKGYVIVFTCNHCPFSIAYEDRLIDLDKKYKALGYPVIAINPNDPAIAPEDSYELMIKRAKEKSFTFPYLFDEGQKVYPKYGATKTPHVYIVSKTAEGNKVSYIGAIDDSKDLADVTQNFLTNALDALVKGETPDPNFTKAFGCSIKVAE